MRYRLDAGLLTHEGRLLLAGVPESVRLDARQSRTGVFLEWTGESGASRHRFALGSIPGLERFTACHRYEPYWMKPTAGTRLSRVPPETQCLLASLEGGGVLFVVPLLDEPCRFSLMGKEDDSLEVLAETGDAHTPAHRGCALWLGVGDDPFELAREGAGEVAARLGSGALRAEKPLPEFTSDFGWCTWDAFYQEVSAEKVFEGLECFRRGGVSPRMMILDDGWQSTRKMPTGEKRLTSLRANEKFGETLAPTVERAKREFGIETFLVWHTIVGYWGGVDGSTLEGYGVIDQTRHFGEGILSHVPTFNNDWWGSLVGFIPEAHIGRFFDEYHRALREQGVDGIKVDSQAVLEALAERQGGRIAVSRAYREALEESAVRHFQGRLLNCMANAQETFYLSPRSTLTRTSIDFFPTRPESHGMHLYANAQVGLWFGQFMHPDWDMFQSGHAWGAFHAAARAVSGGPVYVSDRPGEHDFALLRKLVTGDGRVLRADRPGLPTRKVLFSDPTREPVALEIWTTNGSAGFVGAFNCHVSRETTLATELTASVGPADVPGLTGERFACFRHQADRLSVLAQTEREDATLAPGEFELFTLVPIERGFAALGLSDKFNSHGAVRTLRFLDDENLEIELTTSGAFLAYSERAPRALFIGGDPVPFEYDANSGRLNAALPEHGPGPLRVQLS